MTAGKLMTRDNDKLIPMSGEETETFIKEYKELAAFGVKSEIASLSYGLESPKGKIFSLRKELGEVESSDMLSEIKNRNKARINQNILIYEEEMRRIGGQIQKLDECRHKFLSIRFLRPMLSGLLEKNFYRFGFASIANGDTAVVGWTNFIEIESVKYNFYARQDTIPTVFLLGHYRIEIALLRRSFQLPIKIYNLDSLSSTTYPHPHINELFDPCLGDFVPPIQKCIDEKRFLHAFHLLHIFISSYSWSHPRDPRQNERRPYERAKIEYWPEKGSTEPLKKPPGKEGTGSYDG